MHFKSPCRHKTIDHFCLDQKWHDGAAPLSMFPKQHCKARHYNGLKDFTRVKQFQKKTNPSEMCSGVSSMSFSTLLLLILQTGVQHDEQDYWYSTEYVFHRRETLDVYDMSPSTSKLWHLLCLCFRQNTIISFLPPRCTSWFSQKNNFGFFWPTKKMFCNLSVCELCWLQRKQISGHQYYVGLSLNILGISNSIEMVIVAFNPK